MQDLPRPPVERLLVLLVQLAHTRDVALLLDHGKLTGDLLAKGQSLLLKEKGLK